MDLIARITYDGPSPSAVDATVYACEVVKERLLLSPHIASAEVDLAGAGGLEEADRLLILNVIDTLTEMDRLAKTLPGYDGLPGQAQMDIRGLRSKIAATL